jgi:hypothetical protein
MHIDKSKLTYKPGDTKFNPEDKLMTIPELLEYVMDDESHIMEVVATGAAVWNVLFQGDHRYAGMYLGVQGDPQSSRFKLFKMNEKDLERWNSSGKGIGGEEIAAGDTLSMGIELMSILEFNVDEKWGAHAGKEGPSMTKCAIAGLGAKLRPEEAAKLMVLPGVDEVLSPLLQLR